MNRVHLLLSGVGCMVLLGADWPQWRGPQRDGISQETGLLKEWPKDGPKLLWKQSDIGFGYSTPAVVGDRLYLLRTKEWTTSLCRRCRSRTASRPGRRASATSAQTRGRSTRAR